MTMTIYRLSGINRATKQHDEVNVSGNHSRIDWERALAVGETPLKWVITCYAICRDSLARIIFRHR